jgi:hypothetical protein
VKKNLFVLFSLLIIGLFFSIVAHPALADTIPWNWEVSDCGGNPGNKLSDKTINIQPNTEVCVTPPSSIWDQPVGRVYVGGYINGIEFNHTSDTSELPECRIISGSSVTIESSTQCTTETVFPGSITYTSPSSPPPAPGQACRGLSAGGLHTCVLASSGNVYCNGVFRRRFGDVPVNSYAGGDAVGVTGGVSHACVLRSNGNVYCYGNNSNGQSIGYTGGDAVGVDAGYYHTCVLTSSRNVYCNGANNYGQANNYTGGDAIGMSVEGATNCVLRSNGNVYCYGRYGMSYYGRDAEMVSAGGAGHACVLTPSRNVDCFGSNINGRANDYNGGDAIAVDAGPNHTCVLRSNGNVFCYGGNYSGQANGYNGGDAIGVDASNDHSCVLRSNGNVVCFGYNWSGSTNGYDGGGVEPAVCSLPQYIDSVIIPGTPTVIQDRSGNSSNIVRTETSGDEVSVSIGSSVYANGSAVYPYDDTAEAEAFVSLPFTVNQAGTMYLNVSVGGIMGGYQLFNSRLNVQSSIEANGIPVAIYPGISRIINNRPLPNGYEQIISNQSIPFNAVPGVQYTLLASKDLSAWASLAGSTGYGNFGGSTKILISDKPLTEYPVAEAGGDQTTSIGTTIEIDGSGSSDPGGNPLTYQWEQVGGEYVPLNSHDSAVSNFAATVPGLYRFELVVNNGEFDSRPDYVNVLVA